MKTSTRPFARIRRGVGALAAIMAVLALAGCGVSIPSDPDGTLDATVGGELRVGVSGERGLVDIGDEGPSGSIVDLVEKFAESIDADVTWTTSTEESLIGMLESGHLDLVAGGFTSDTPWAQRAGVTRGYENTDGADGRTLVMLVPEGENAFLSRLEAFLDQEVGS